MQKMEQIEKLTAKAKALHAKIIFPEADKCERIRDAIDLLLKEDICEVCVIGKRSLFPDPRITVYDPERMNIDELAIKLYELRRHKGLKLAEAREILTDRTHLATMLVYTGAVDGMVAGAITTSADVLRPALQLLRSHKQFINSAMLMVKPNAQPLLFADIALNIDPSAEELTNIARNSLDFYNQIVGRDKMALLSYSTLGSGKGDSADKMRECARLLNEQKVTFLGEVQADVALSTEVAKQKKVKSNIAGKANVLIFPNIDAGNIGYKLVQRLADYTAIGPITVGLDRPVNDLSRGSTVQDIFYTTIITILQTEHKENL